MKKQLEASNMERRLAAQRLANAIGKKPEKRHEPKKREEKPVAQAAPVLATRTA